MSEFNASETISEGYELPSQGKIYPQGKVPSYIKFRSMTGLDELKRVAPSARPLKNLSEVMDNCIVGDAESKPKVNAYDMAIGDWEFMLHKLRTTSLGNNYPVNISCSYCGKPINTVADLSTIEVKAFDENEWEKNRLVTLPESGTIIGLTYTTPHLKEDIIIKANERRTKFPDINFDVETLFSLIGHIKTIDGNMADSIKVESFIKTLGVKDVVYLLQKIEDLDKCVGIDNILVVECPHCHKNNLTFFRFGTEFFRPHID